MEYLHHPPPSLCSAELHSLQLLSMLLLGQSHHYWYNARFFLWQFPPDTDTIGDFTHIGLSCPYECLRNRQQGPLSPESKSSKTKCLLGIAIWIWFSNSADKLNPKLNRDKKEPFLQNLLLFPTLIQSTRNLACLSVVTTDQHPPSKSLQAQ